MCRVQTVLLLLQLKCPKTKKRKKKDNYKISNFMVLEEIKSGTLLVLGTIEYHELSNFILNFCYLMVPPQEP